MMDKQNREVLFKPLELFEAPIALERLCEEYNFAISK